MHCDLVGIKSRRVAPHGVRPPVNKLVSSIMLDSQPLRIVFFGDSICVGQGVSLYKGWVTRIAEELDRLSLERNREVIVVNSSINGRTTRQALEDMPYHVQSNGVDVLIVQFGLNDCNYWATDMGLPRVSEKAFVANLEEIIMRGLKFGAKSIILNNNHPTSRTTQVFPHTDLTYQDANRQYNSAIRELALSLEGNIQFNDIEAHFESHMRSGVEIADCLLSDGLHLSVTGHQLYYEFLSPILGKVISDLQSDDT